jgi:DNA-binding ferritin-like protein
MEHRYDKSENVLRSAAERFKDMIKVHCRVTYQYYYELARTWRFQERLHNAETKLRDLLKDYEKSITPNRKLDMMRELAEVIMETGR